MGLGRGRLGGRGAKGLGRQVGRGGGGAGWVAPTELSRSNKQREVVLVAEERRSERAGRTKAEVR